MTIQKATDKKTPSRLEIVFIACAAMVVAIPTFGSAASMASLDKQVDVPQGIGTWQRIDLRANGESEIGTDGRRLEVAQEGDSVMTRTGKEQVRQDENVALANEPDATPDEIGHARKLLIALGYRTGRATGTMNPQISAAIVSFQKDHGLEVKSAVSGILIDQLRVALAARHMPPPPPDNLELVSSATGFVVSDDGHLLTNQHVVEGCDAMRVRDLGWANIEASDEDIDLALISLESGTVPGVASFRSWPSVALGEAVVVFGFPERGVLSASGNATTGVISALEGGADEDYHQYQFTAPTQDGNSGGPLLDGAGNVIGVLVSGISELEAVNFAIKGEVAISFLIRNGLQPVVVSGKPTRPRPTEAVIAEAMHYTVSLECWEESKSGILGEERDSGSGSPLDFGADDLDRDDLGEWNGDGECDDPRFAGDGMGSRVFTHLAGRDATDCRALFDAGKIRLRKTGDIAGLDFGDDSSQWANDGECDDPSFEGSGMAMSVDDHDQRSDASDCRDAFATGMVWFRGERSAADHGDASGSGDAFDFGADDLEWDGLGKWNGDGECDDPRFAGDGMGPQVFTHLSERDATDCRALFDAGTIRLRQTGEIAGLDFGNDSSEWSEDGQCDDPSFEGPGMAAIVNDDDLLSDASDCRDAFAAGQVWLR